MADTIKFENHGDSLTAVHFDEDSQLWISIKCKNRLAASSYGLTIDEATELRDHLDRQLKNETDNKGGN